MQAFPLTLADIEARAPAPQAAEVVQRIRNSHHGLARLIAEGRKSGDIQAITGYSAGHISRLSADPAFIELVEHYRTSINAEYVSVHAQLAGLAADTVQELHERLREKPDEFTVAQLTEMAKAVLDRSGFGPTKTVNNNNLNAQVGPEMLASVREQARQQRGEIKRIGQETSSPPHLGSDTRPVIDGKAIVHSEVSAPREQSAGHPVREARSPRTKT